MEKQITETKRIQVVLTEDDIINRFNADIKATGMKESQLCRLIITQYYYAKKVQSMTASDVFEMADADCRKRNDEIEQRLLTEQANKSKGK